MKILALEAENIKRLVAVEIHPDGNLVQITGRNGQGKTSVLDSIWWALAGAKHIQVAPIRKGANHARIKLDMGEIVVTRTFKREKDGEGFTTKLEVVGAVKGTPQGMLDSLLDSLAFDPLAFARKDAKEKFDALKKYVPDVDFDKIAAHNSIDFSARADKNKRAKEERVLADQIQLPAKEAAGPVDEDALVAQLAEAGRHNQEIETRKMRRQQTGEEIERIRAKANEKTAEIHRLGLAIEVLAKEANDLDATADDLVTKLETAEPLPTPVDVTEIQRQIAGARAVNAEIKLRNDKLAHERKADQYEAEAKVLTDRMKQREEEKRKAVAGAKLPIADLSFGDGVVLLNGVPFEQASDAEQLKASCALAMAGSPQLKVLRVRDGSLLDDESLELLARMAEERDYQVWIERVGTGEVGFILEDGHLIQREKEQARQESLPIEEAAL